MASKKVPRKGPKSPTLPGQGYSPTTVVFFPFDLFGSAGSGAGADLLADELREILADNQHEQVFTRAAAYQDYMRLTEVVFETPADYQDWRRQGRHLARRALDAGERLLWVAGNHLGVLPVYDELGADTLVVQLDAHLDIHHFSDCTRELSHGNFLRHVEGDRPAVINVGHRELLLLPDDIRAFFRAAHPAAALAVDPGRCLQQLQQAARGARRVFVDIDCDVFDPAYFPAAPRPVPFGLTPQQVLGVLEAVWSERVAGVAFSEFDPGRDRNDQGLSTVVWLIEYLLLKWYEPEGTDGVPKR